MALSSPNWKSLYGSWYSASHSRVAPEKVGLQKEQNYNTFACHTCNEVRLCFVNSQKGSWQHEKIIPKHTTTLHYRCDMQMYCNFVLFVNQHFLGLPASGTHCIWWFVYHQPSTLVWKQTDQWRFGQVRYYPIEPWSVPSKSSPIGCFPAILIFDARVWTSWERQGCKINVKKTFTGNSWVSDFEGNYSMFETQIILSRSFKNLLMNHVTEIFPPNTHITDTELKFRLTLKSLHWNSNFSGYSNHYYETQISPDTQITTTKLKFCRILKSPLFFWNSNFG
jgi:hypothetical protein